MKTPSFSLKKVQKTAFFALAAALLLFHCKPKTGPTTGGGGNSTTPPPQPSVLTVVGPICQSAQNVLVRGASAAAEIEIFRAAESLGKSIADDRGEASVSIQKPLAVGEKITARQRVGSQQSPESPAAEVVAGVPTKLEIIGGQSFFRPETGENPIDAPVFLRNEKSGVSIAVSSCCAEKTTLEIWSPAGKAIAQIALPAAPTGSFSVAWDWKNSIAGGVLPIGKYQAVLKNPCDPQPTRASFYVIFDPAEVSAAARFGFSETNVWFGAHTNASRGLLYHLHPDDARVFSMAINAASGETSVLRAAQKICDAEEAKFKYSLAYHTNDVLELLEKFDETQCADDANFLVALLRSVGIPSKTATADAALETGAANWTFDTWTEFLVKKTADATAEWLVLHPHEYPDMSPETRRKFGTARGVATKNFNDIMIAATENWKQNEASDGQIDVAYSRNECQEPAQNWTAKSWIEDLGGGQYWEQPFWECAATASKTAASKVKMDLNLGDAGFGRSVSGSLEAAPGNSILKASSGPPTVQIVGDLPESKRFPDTVFSIQTVSFSRSAGLSRANFDLKMPATAPAGMEIWAVSASGKKINSAQPISISSGLKASLKMTGSLALDSTAVFEATVLNGTKKTISGATARFSAPFAVKIDGSSLQNLGSIQPGETKKVVFRARVLAPIEAAEAEIRVNSADGGGATAAWPFSVK